MGRSFPEGGEGLKCLARTVVPEAAFFYGKFHSWLSGLFNPVKAFDGPEFHNHLKLLFNRTGVF